MRAHLLLMIVAATSVEARAQQRTATTVPAITEAELLAKLTGDPRIARIAAGVESARAEAIAAALRANPTVSYEREEVFPDGGGVGTSYVRLSLPVEISGRRAARRDAARARVDAAAAEGDSARFALSMQALRMFRTAAHARAKIELLAAERSALQAAVEIVRKRASAGTASGYDLQRIELELAAYDDLVAAAHTELARERLALGALVGIPAGVDAADSLPIPPDPPALASLLADSLGERPELRAAAARRKGADALARSARRAWIPELALTAGYMRQDVAADTTASGYSATLGMSLPIFDHGQDDRARANAQRRAAEAERQLLARTVPTQVRAHHQGLVDTIARARSVERDQLARLEPLLRSAETAYREGSGNVVELVDAYTAARDTRLRDLDLRRDARLAEIDLWLALGRRP